MKNCFAMNPVDRPEFKSIRYELGNFFINDEEEKYDN
jgi:hypothetical protein